MGLVAMFLAFLLESTGARAGRESVLDFRPDAQGPVLADRRYYSGQMNSLRIRYACGG